MCVSVCLCVCVCVCLCVCVCIFPLFFLVQVLGESLVTNAVAALISDGVMDFSFNVTLNNTVIPIDVALRMSLPLPPFPTFG